MRLRTALTRPTGATTTYTYDLLDRLTQAHPTKLNGKDREQEPKAEGFTYDPVGNCLTGPRAKDTSTYNIAQQLTTDRTHDYQYDRNGNLIRRVERDDEGEETVLTFAYDGEQRLLRVVKQEEDETRTVTFQYDPFGRRVSKTIEEQEGDERETQTHTYVYDNEDIIVEVRTTTETEHGRTETKTSTTRFLHGPGVDEPLAVEQKGQRFEYHADGLGTVTALTDAKQKVVERLEYTAFGVLKQHGDKVTQPYAFTGREFDKETGLYYYRARYYDPKVGRFTQFDPLLHPSHRPPRERTKNPVLPATFFPLPLDALRQTPQALNAYVYVQNRPTVLTDPSGLGPQSVCCPQNSLLCTVTCVCAGLACVCTKDECGEFSVLGVFAIANRPCDFICVFRCAAFTALIERQA